MEIAEAIPTGTQPFAGNATGYETGNGTGTVPSKRCKRIFGEACEEDQKRATRGDRGLVDRDRGDAYRAIHTRDFGDVDLPVRADVELVGECAGGGAGLEAFVFAIGGIDTGRNQGPEGELKGLACKRVSAAARPA